MTPEAKVFGANLRVARHAAKLTQEALAERAGVTANFIAHLERGSRSPSLETIFALAEATGVQPPDLIAEVKA